MRAIHSWRPFTQYDFTIYETKRNVASRDKHVPTAQHSTNAIRDEIRMRHALALRDTGLKNDMTNEPKRISNDSMHAPIVVFKSVRAHNPHRHEVDIKRKHEVNWTWTSQQTYAHTTTRMYHKQRGNDELLSDESTWRASIWQELLRACSSLIRFHALRALDANIYTTTKRTNESATSMYEEWSCEHKEGT